MKATWQGYIALGQLGIPAKLYSASRSIRPQFVQLHEKDSSPVERVLKCSSENHEISYNQDVILL
jgi:non-homologous end joining protein Ku